jgi:hypothetical protein
MTDRSASPRQARTTRGGVLAAVWTALAVFLALLSLFAMRMAGGQDPAVRARATATVPARRVLIRRVLERRVIVHLPPTAPLRPTQALQQVSSAIGSLVSPVVTRTS